MSVGFLKPLEIFCSINPGTGGSKMARTFTKSELLEPVRLARKLMKRVRAGTLDINKATDLLVQLLPLNPVQDPFAGT